MKIAVASGKGGTGKTLVSTNLFNVIENSTYIDCDVEEPNGHLFLNAKPEKEITVSTLIPAVDTSKCNSCGICAKVCNFNAILCAKNKVIVFPELCHGCGSCTYFCPLNAISEIPREIGKIEISSFKHKKVYTGRLNVGEAMAPPLIKQLKEKNNSFSRIIIDCPPGTSCPVIESIKGSDFVILVTEPTPFGLNDLRLAVEVVKKTKIPFGIIINKSGLGGTIIHDYCKVDAIPILLEIPHDKWIAEAYSKGKLITEEPFYKTMFTQLHEKILQEHQK